MSHSKSVVSLDQRRAADTSAGRELALEAARIGLDKKAEAPAVLDVQALNTYADFFVLLSGTNERQVLAITDSVVDALKKEGQRPIGVEGTDRGHWVLIDYGDVVVHVLKDDAREFYDLDGLWADALRVEVPGAPAQRLF